MKLVRATALIAVLLADGPVALAEAAAPPAVAQASAPARGLSTRARTWTGDLDVMFERRVIRVLVPYSRTLYFNDRGRERGMSADAVRGFERWLNKRRSKQLGNRPITVVMIPTTRDRLLSDVASGRGDISAGNLTITAARAQVVDFVSDPDAPDVTESVVTGSRSAPLASTDDLAGRTVHVRRSSSYFESLQSLNTRLATEGKRTVDVVLVPDALEDEDLLEMADAGMVDAVVVDDWVARIWAHVFTRVRMNEQAVLRRGARIGWATRKDSPRLQAEIAAYMKAEGTKGNIAVLVNECRRLIKRLDDPTAADERRRFEELHGLFAKYGQKYRFDPLMLAAQGYQESRLDQTVHSRVGAIGVMQVMPATGQTLGVGDIRVTEPNIHAGAKYLDQLMARYFADAGFDEANRTLFAFASYNAGPGNISRMRKLAAKSGLDPNQWFNHVEVVTARRLGVETTTYVRNIYKYYVAYKLMDEAQLAARRARQQVTTDTGH
jgi:membrane-bound lytic murein transglycosylase MltF